MKTGKAQKNHEGVRVQREGVVLPCFKAYIYNKIIELGVSFRMLWTIGIISSKWSQCVTRIQGIRQNKKATPWKSGFLSPQSFTDWFSSFQV